VISSLSDQQRWPQAANALDSSMTIDAPRILAALGRERELATAGAPFVVTDAWHAGGQPILRIEAKPGAKATPVDESLGGALLVWGGTTPVRADVLYVDAEESRLVLDGLTGVLPRPGDIVVAYPPDLARQRGLGKLRISTVHRSQGSESRIVLFDPVDADTPFLRDANGRRLINFAISRGQAQVIVFATDSDLTNPWLARVATYATENGTRFANALATVARTAR
jgi:UvrD-like helicase C-terminal domain